jgi:hypothetical protein
MGPHPEFIPENGARIPAAILPLNSSKIAAGALQPQRYSEQFATVLAEKRWTASRPAKVRIALVPSRRGLSPDDARHLPALMAAGLAFLLLAGSGGASWYAIVGVLPRDAEMTAGTLLAASDNSVAAPAALPSAVVESRPPVPGDAHRPVAASPSPEEWSMGEVWLPAALDPVLSEPVAIEPAAAPVAPPPVPAAQPEPDVVAMAAAPSAMPDEFIDPPEAPADAVPDPGSDTPVTAGSRDSKGPLRISFVDPDPEKAASGLPGITTASEAQTGAAAGSGGTTAAPSASGGDRTGDHTKKSGSGHHGSGSTGKQDAKDTKGGKGHSDKDKDQGGPGHGGKDNGGKDNGGKGNGGKGSGKGAD